MPETELAVKAIVMPHLLADRREHMTVTPGTTIAEMVAAALPGCTENDRRQVRVMLGEHVIPAENWARVRPKPSATVVLRVVPTGGSFRTILAIVVTIAAVALGQFYLAPQIVGAFGLYGAAEALVTAGVGRAEAGRTTA
jgi:hypothetical protein